MMRTGLVGYCCCDAVGSALTIDKETSAPARMRFHTFIIVPLRASSVATRCVRHRERCQCHPESPRSRLQMKLHVILRCCNSQVSALCTNAELCVPKIRFGNIGGEVRRGSAVRRWLRRSQSPDGLGRPCSTNDGSAMHYSRAHRIVGRGVNG